MKKILNLLVAGVFALALAQPLLAGANKDKSAAPAASTTLVIGATPVPHAELLGLITQDLAAQGITLVIREFTDYATPNEAVLDGSLFANFHQHLPYLQTRPAWAASLVSVFGVHIEPIGLYSHKVTSIADLKDGATIAIPNDVSNGGRSLLLLQANNLITIDPATGLNATVADITANPHNFKFSELDPAQLPRSLADVDAAVINGNYALEAGLNPVRDSLIIEGASSPYVNIVVVKKGNENDPRVAALKAALCSQKVKDFINATYNGGVIATF
jgi:D-methionine transport system substrate-binding protein